LVLALVATEANGQDRDDPGDRNSLRHPTGDRSDATSPYDPNDEAEPPNTQAPASQAKPVEPSESQPKGDSKSETTTRDEEIQFKADGKAHLELGYDSNVFRAETGRRGDGFFHGYGEAELTITFPGERELSASVSGEAIQYFHQGVANETYADSFVTYYQPLSSVFAVEVQNSFEYSAQNLLDDNGDLLPRAKFDSYDEDARATLLAHLGSRVSLELSGGGRYNAFEDNPGLPALTYYEARGSGGIRVKPWADGRFRVRYVFRDRRYTELPANVRDGTNVPGDPLLELYRHQVITTFAQKVDVFGMRFVGQLGYTLTYNLDLFQNDRTYREDALTARLEWWPFPDWSELAFDLRASNRDFLVRRTLQRGNPAFGTRLEQSYIEMTLSASQKIIEHVSIVGELSWYLYHSTDVRASYERFVAQGGIEASF
jgi:hypothetical protein